MTFFQGNRKWLLPVKLDSCQAQSIVCTTEINVSYGARVVKKHEETPKYAAMVKAESTHKRFFSDNGVPYMPKAGERVPLTPEEKKWNSEILGPFNAVENNYLFDSCASDNQLYGRMLSDSDIVKSFQQTYTKEKYMIQYRIIKLYVFNLILTSILMKLPPAK